MKKAQTSREEGMAMISNWKTSGKSYQEFCLEQSIPYHRLRYWHGVYNRIKSGEGKKGHNKFIPISVLARHIASPGIEIQTPGGYSIKLYQSVDLKALISILR